MDPKTIFCYGEPGEFPSQQFRRNEQGQLCVPYIHDVSRAHYVTGELVSDDEQEIPEMFFDQD